MLDKVVKHLDCLRPAALLQSLEKCTCKSLQVLAAVTRLELEKGFPDRRVNTVLVQHARDMRSASRQLHLATIEAPDSSVDRLRLAPFTSIPRFSGRRLPRRFMNAGWRVAARQSD
jgi:hypothetical protein